jgi:hypothetical protein
MSNDNNRNQGNPGQKNPQQPGHTQNNPMRDKDKSRTDLNNKPKIDPNKREGGDKR